MRSHLLETVLIALAAGTVLFFASCTLAPPDTAPTGQTTVSSATLTPADFPTIPERGFFMGILPTPSEAQSFEDAYRQVATWADFVPAWGRPTPFYDMAEELSGDWGQTFVDQYTRGKEMFPLVQMSFIGPDMGLVSPPGISTPALNNKGWRDAYKQAAVDVVRAALPPYLSLGNEVNRWYERYGAAEEDPNGFQNYVSLYEETYYITKRVSPGTQVFCTFAREIVSENREADMSVLHMFDAAKIDILVLTSYPHALCDVNRPSDIPDDYFSNLEDYMPGIPMRFSEVAWPSLEAFGGEQAQADFLSELCGRLTRDQGIQIELPGWPWLHDLDGDDNTGLMKQDGTAKLAYGTWKSH